MQYSTVQYSAVQYSAVQYSTVQYSTVQYSPSHLLLVLAALLPRLLLLRDPQHVPLGDSQHPVLCVQHRQLLLAVHLNTKLFLKMRVAYLSQTNSKYVSLQGGTKVAKIHKYQYYL